VLLKDCQEPHKAAW